jgi:chitosanase
MITKEQIRICKAIVSIFETGNAQGDYTKTTILSDGAGISYGAHQATDRAGSLDRIVKRYLALGGARQEDARRVLELLDDDGTIRYSSLSSASPEVRAAAQILRELGSEPTMIEAQDQIFDELYWRPAQYQCEAMALVLPLSWAVVYDTCVHSGLKGVDRIRARFPAACPANGGLETSWTAAYVEARRAYLAGHSNELVRRTVYRPDAFAALIRERRWSLALPFAVRGVAIP